MLVQRLRRVAREYLDRNLYSDAVFHADKLVTMTNGKIFVGKIHKNQKLM